MTPARLLADTYAYFRDHGHWPLVRTLQTGCGPRLSVRAIAAEAGRDNIFCEEGADGRCVITLRGLATMPAAADDIERLVTAVSFIAKQFGQHGAVPVDHAAIGETLGLHGVELARLGALLRLTSRLWSGGSWSPDNSAFSVTPTEEAYFFRDVKSFKDFEAARTQVDRDDRRIAEVLSTEYRRARGESPATQLDELPTRYRLADAALDALLQRDLAELAEVHSLGAWKSAAVLAGTCLETLLYDVCKRREKDCQGKWGGKWPSRVTASDLARFAATRQWITEDHGQLATVLRRWRNIVHPNAALAAGEPTKEIADALVSVLKLFVADLARNEAR